MLGNIGIRTPLCTHRNKPRGRRVRKRIGGFALLSRYAPEVPRRQHIHCRRRFSPVASDSYPYPTFLPSLHRLACVIRSTLRCSLSIVTIWLMATIYCLFREVDRNSSGCLWMNRWKVSILGDQTFLQEERGAEGQTVRTLFRKRCNLGSSTRCLPVLFSPPCFLFWAA